MTMPEPKISIVIPVYNAESYLRACLDSAVQQTLREIEIICVDDGSTDASLQILREYAARDARIRVETQENLGGGAARNHGMALACGEYVYHLDADDVMDLTLCEKTYAKALETDADIVAFFYQVFEENRSCGAKGAGAESTSEATESECCQRLKALFHDTSRVLRYNGGTPWCALRRRSMLVENQITFPEHVISHDTEFAADSIICARKIAVLEEPLYGYRVVASSISHVPKNVPNRYVSSVHVLEAAKKRDIPDDAMDVLVTFVLTKFLFFWDKPLSHAVRRETRKRIKTETPAWVWEVVQKSRHLPPDIKAFYQQFFGSSFQRLRARMKRRKYALADWLAKKLLAYSPWMWRNFRP